MPSPTLLDLPEEVLATKVLAALPHEDLRLVRLVNRGFHAAASLAVDRLRPRRLASLALDAYPRLHSLDVSEAEDWGESFLDRLAEAPRLAHLKLGPPCTVTAVGAEALAQHCTQLQSLDLSCAPISDSCLLRLEGRLPALRSLVLHDCCSLTDAGLAALGSWRGLEEVDLSNVWKLSDATLQQLARLPSLTKVDLTGCERFTAAGLAALGAGLPALRTLLLPACWQLTDDALAAVAASMPRLSCLGLFEAGEAVSDVGLRQLTSLAGSLTALDLGYSCWSHTPTGLTALLPHLTGLRMLNLGGWEGGCDEAAAAVAAHCRQLTQLDVSENQRLTPAGVRALGALPQLAELCLGWNLRLTEAALEALPPSLTRLDLSFCAEMGDGALRLLGALPRLAVLSLRKCSKVTDQGLAHLGAAASLRQLDLSYTGITAAGMAHLAALPCLESLALADCPRAVSPPGMHLLAASSSSRLTRLDLSNNKRLDDGGMQALSHIRSLRCLVLQACPKVSDSGLAALSRLTALRSLSLDRCQQLSTAAVGRLRRKLPLLHDVQAPAAAGVSRFAVGWAHQPTGRLL